MEKFSLKLLPILLVFCTLFNHINCCGRPNKCSFHNRGPHNRGPHNRTPPHHNSPQRGSPHHPRPNRCRQDDHNQTTIETTFVYESGTVKAGDQLQCKLVNVTLVSNSSRSRCDAHIFTQAAYSPDALTFLPVSNNSKCFSFQVHTYNADIHLHFSNTPVFQHIFEAVLSINGFTRIMHNFLTIIEVKTPVDVNNNQNLLPFWVRYDNNLVEVGYGNSTVPYISHQFQSQDGFPSPVNYIGLLSAFNPGEWIIDADPVCGTKNSTASNPTPTQPQVKTVCKVKTGRPSRRT